MNAFSGEAVLEDLRLIVQGVGIAQHREQTLLKWVDEAAEQT